MFNFTFTDVLTPGGFVFLILIGSSVLSLKVIIEKWITLSALHKKNILDFNKQIKQEIKNSGDLKDAIDFCKSNTTKRFGFPVAQPLSNVFVYIFSNISKAREELLDLALVSLDEEIMQMEKRIGILGTLGNIAPFIGLFGTVLGIIKSFEGLSITEMSNYASVMSGIAEALISTAAGLVVAIPSVMFYNYFIKKIKHSIPLLEKQIKEFIYLVKKAEK